MDNTATSKLGNPNYTNPSFLRGGGIYRVEQNECLSKPGVVSVQCCCVGPGNHRAQLCDCRQRFKTLWYLGASENTTKGAYIN